MQLRFLTKDKKASMNHLLYKGFEGKSAKGL